MPAPSMLAEHLEHLKGFEPSHPAWKAGALPIRYRCKQKEPTADRRLKRPVVALLPLRISDSIDSTLLFSDMSDISDTFQKNFPKTLLIYIFLC